MYFSLREACRVNNFESANTERQPKQLSEVNDKQVNWTTTNTTNMNHNQFQHNQDDDVNNGGANKKVVPYSYEFAVFLSTKAHKFPYNQLKNKNQQIEAGWIVLKETNQGRRDTCTIKSSNIPPDALTHLIVTGQAIPYTPAMSNVMDYMFDGSIAVYYPEWYVAVTSMMEEFLQNSNSAAIQRSSVFFHAIKLQLETVFEKEVGKFSGFVVQKWADWFYATGYNEEIEFGDLILDSIEKGREIIATLETISGGIEDYEDYY